MHPHTEIQFLFREFYRNLKKESAHILAAQDLTNNDFFFLRILGKNDGIRASDIAGELGVQRGYISGLIKRMEKRKLIQKSPVLTDGRGISLSLTPEGKKILDSLDGAILDLIAGKLDHLKEAEARSLLKALRKLVHSQEQENPRGKS